MKGIVKYVNNKRQLYAVLTENGSYAGFEILGGDELELEEELHGNLENLAGETLYSPSQEIEIDVFMEIIMASKNVAMNFVIGKK